MKVSDRRVHIVFCDVGQGDAQLIYQGLIQVLVDAGAKEERVLKCLGEHLPFWDRRIEMVISTHPDKDHVGGMDGVLRSYEVGLVVISDVEGKNGEYREVREEIKKQKIKVVEPMAGDRLRVGSLEFDVLSPDLERLKEAGVDMGDTNNWSVVSLFRYGKFEAMLTGDATNEVEAIMLAQGIVSTVEVLKVGHHGSKYSSGEAWLEALNPKLAVIQVGKNNYGHPTEEVLDRLKALGIKIMRNDTQGEIEVSTDGNKWWVR